MLFNTPPERFSPQFEACGCYLISKGKFLMLERASHKEEPGTWCSPGGKIEYDETAEQAISRELMEEIGLILPLEKLQHIATYFVRHPKCDFVYHVFITQFDTPPRITLHGNEHTSYKWVTKEQALTLPLILDEDECIKNTFSK